MPTEGPNFFPAEASESESAESKVEIEADRRALSIDSFKESPERMKKNQLTVIKDLVDEESESDEANHNS